MQQQLPAHIAALEAQDTSLRRYGFDNIRVTPELMDVYRSGDDAELGRMVRLAVREGLKNRA